MTLTNQVMILLPLVLGVYFFGVNMGATTQKKKDAVRPWSSKYWHTCKDCMPGVTMKYGADTLDHLDQLIGWHEADFHEIEKEGEIVKDALNPYRGVYIPKTNKLHLVRDTLCKLNSKYSKPLRDEASSLLMPIENSNVVVYDVTKTGSAIIGPAILSM